MQWDPKLCTTGDRLLPRPVGKVTERATGRRMLVYDVQGPAVTMRVSKQEREGEELTREGAMLICDLRDQRSLPVRRLESLEVWRVAGGTAREWKEGLEAGLGEKDLLEGAARASPHKTVAALLQATAEIRTKSNEPARGKRSGVVEDEEVVLSHLAD